MTRAGSSPVHPAIFESLLQAPHRDFPLERLDRDSMAWMGRKSGASFQARCEKSRKRSPAA